MRPGGGDAEASEDGWGLLRSRGLVRLLCPPSTWTPLATPEEQAEPWWMCAGLAKRRIGLPERRGLLVADWTERVCGCGALAVQGRWCVPESSRWISV